MSQHPGIRDQGAGVSRGASPDSGRENVASALKPDSGQRRPRDLTRFTGPIVILLAATLATVPQWIRGCSCGHDFDFHLVSWLDALQSWREGLFYPHWTVSPNYGAGEPRFIFYPPLTWMLGAALGAVLPWRLVPGVITFLLLAATGLATRALARRALVGRVCSEGVATLAGCAAIFSGYALFTAYERSAFAEMTGGFWTPLLLLFLLHDTGPASSRPTGSPAPVSTLRRLVNLPLIAMTLIVAGAWLSNAPVGVMIGYLLAATGLTLAVLERFQGRTGERPSQQFWIPAARAALAGLLGTGLAAFYLVPAAWEQRWVDIRQAVDDPGYKIENSWLFARHADPRLELHDVELLRVSAIGASMIAVALGGLLLATLRRRLPPDRRWWIPLALIPIVVLFLQLPVSLPVWNALPKLRFLQFPWRWLVVLEAPMALFFAAAIWPARRRLQALVIAGSAILCLVATTAGGITFFQACDEEDAVSAMVAAWQAGEGFEGTDEYAPPAADNSLVATGLPAACLVTDPDTVLGKGEPDVTPEWSPDQGSCQAVLNWSPSPTRGAAEHRRLDAIVPHAGYLVLRLREYPAWRVLRNGTTVTRRPVRQDGLMTVPVPAGPVHFAIDWTTTPDVLAGRLVSLLTLALVTTAAALASRQAKRHLS